MPDELTQPPETLGLEPVSVIPAQAVLETEQAPEAPPEAPEAAPAIPISAPAETSVLAPETAVFVPISLPVPEPVPVQSSPIQPIPIEQSVIQSAPQSNQPDPRSFLQKALDAIQFRKRSKLEKIIKYVEQKSSITNDQAEKLLHISDATATRYLSQLVKEGRLKRTGPAGNARYDSLSLH